MNNSQAKPSQAKPSVMETRLAILKKSQDPLDNLYSSYKDEFFSIVYSYKLTINNIYYNGLVLKKTVDNIYLAILLEKNTQFSTYLGESNLLYNVLSIQLLKPKSIYNVNLIKEQFLNDLNNINTISTEAIFIKYIVSSDYIIFAEKSKCFIDMDNLKPDENVFICNPGDNNNFKFSDIIIERKNNGGKSSIRTPYEKRTLTQLRSLAKSRKIANYAKLTKTELIAKLRR